MVLIENIDLIFEQLLVYFENLNYLMKKMNIAVMLKTLP
jgi:hypothetical protein